VHAIVAASLEKLGVPSRLAPGQDGPAFTGFLCFQHLTIGDLLIGKDKVVGSAQRRHRGALLQHGAILLAASPHAPVLPGIAELSGRVVTISELIDVLLSLWAHDTGWRLRDDGWFDGERRRLQELVEHKYSQPYWNAKR
jgi:lipoate-protein ligase A